MKVAELQGLASSMGIGGTAKMRKGDLVEEAVDVTLPYDRRPAGARHPLTTIMERIEDVFARHGLTFEGAISDPMLGAYLLDQRRIRMLASLGAVMIWTFLSVAFGIGNPYGTGIIVYPTLAFTSALIFWRLYTHRVED